MQHQHTPFGQLLLRLGCHRSAVCSLKSEWRVSAAAPAFAFDADFSRATTTPAEASELHKTLPSADLNSQRRGGVNSTGCIFDT